MNKIKRYGWKRGLPVFGRPKFEKACMAAMPMRADLTGGFPACYDQLDLGSCTANAGGGLAQFLTRKLGFKDYMPARLAIYFWTRQHENTVSEDAGASLGDTATVLANKGVPNEVNWPYRPDRFAYTPPAAVVANGQQHLLVNPMQVAQNLDDLRACLAFGFPIMFGFAVYEDFEGEEVEKTGILKMPDRSQEPIGGHAVLLVGYDDYTQMFKVRNSWGTKWGQNGYFWMPYDYVCDPNLADDFWTAHTITGYREKK